MAERKFAWPARADAVLIGKDIQRIDGVAKASGQAKYTADINTQGTLFARLATCPHAAAKLAAIDGEAAKNVNGVRAVHLFKKVGDEMRWDGELIAAVAADRAEQAADGIKAIEATIKYEVLPHFVDDTDVKGAEPAQRFQQLTKNAKGDVEAAINGASVVHKGHYGIATISHMCLEPHGSHCEWNGEDLSVHLSTQNVSGTPGQFAEPLGIEAANVTVTSDYEGGGFGSKFQADECAWRAPKWRNRPGNRCG
jgi:xanthine dehydrogenase YagR molybdenum-binding subunit